MTSVGVPSVVYETVKNLRQVCTFLRTLLCTLFCC